MTAWLAANGCRPVAGVRNDPARRSLVTRMQERGRRAARVHHWKRSSVGSQLSQERAPGAFAATTRMSTEDSTGSSAS